MIDLLAGVRILDLTNVLAGPYCAYQLGLLGADVVKVEAPEGGDLARQLGADAALNGDLMGASFLAQNAGKRSIALNLKDSADRAAFLALVASADVLVENFRPGVMDRLGLGHSALADHNPGLIYCAISGFGATGPMKNAPAYDQIIQGYSGLMSVTGTPETAPLRVGVPICDTLGGLSAAFAIAAALVRRQRDGRGCYLDVSLLESTISALGWAVSNHLIAGKAPIPMGNDNFTASPSGTFQTGDGLLNIAANKAEQFGALAKLVGREDWLTDPRFADRGARLANRTALTQELEAALASASALEWETRMIAAGIPAGQVLSVPAILRHPQTVARDMVTPFEGEAIGLDRTISCVRGGFCVDGEAPRPNRPPPRLDAHRAEILAELAQ
jgi:crotonobetainyl-CoA:carnitine CoA-transferase CaiB-like acyl-CoA transferase